MKDMKKFELQSSYSPSGDQPEAIKTIVEGFTAGQKQITLLGATGTGKTFTMANIIQKLQVPTLVISHNKTLAAQLATEFKYFFPDNAVHYFVSYFDYYQPESYLSDRDIYIEKEATINSEIEMYRLSTMASLLERKDTIVVSSVSALYGLGDKEFFREYSLHLSVGDRIMHKELKKKLIDMRYEPVKSSQALEAGTFDVRGDMRDIFSSTEKIVYRLHFTDEKLEYIEKKDSLTWETIGNTSLPDVWIWPATQYIQDTSDMQNILIQIEAEMNDRVKELLAQGKDLEANRLQKRTMFDIRMIKETGFVNGIENYSMYFEKRNWGDTPNTIFDYFPDDMLIIMDESHMSVPQLQGMPSADKTRKHSLVNHGFRLPSALEHRPLGFHEVKAMLWRDTNEPEEALSAEELEIKKQSKTLNKHIKPKAKTLYVSATPAPFELERSETIAEQIIRPTGLLDPVTYVYPKSGDYGLLMKNIEKTVNKKPFLKHFYNGYDDEDDLKEELIEIFEPTSQIKEITDLSEIENPVMKVKGSKKKK
jgi:excinuclease ABC subunit B